MLGATVAAADPIPTARLDPLAPPSVAELAAADRMDARRCGPSLGLLFPGVGQLCTRRPVEGGLLLGLGVAELAAGGAALALTDPPPASDPFGSPGRTVLFVAVQDLWVYGVSRSTVDLALARHQLYAPPDELPGMLAAPFDPRVMRRPSVFAAILVLSAGGTALQWGLDTPTGFGGRPNLFGARPPEALGYPLAAGMHGLLMSHVAVAEEIAFRGIVQSGAARATSETGGWLIGSAVFGPLHAANALLLPEDERVYYLAVAVPWITITGSWLGLVYRWGDYSLTGPIAVHWWYNMLVSATAFAANPEDNTFNATIRVRW